MNAGDGARIAETFGRAPGAPPGRPSVRPAAGSGTRAERPGARAEGCESRGWGWAGGLGRVVDRGGDFVGAGLVLAVGGGGGGAGAAADQFLDLGDGQDFLLDEGVGQALHLVAMLLEQAVGALVGLA